MLRKAICTALAATILLGAQPAEAGGSVSVTIEASNGRERETISQFLQFAAVGSAAVEVLQRGSGNAAAVGQRGWDNRALVSQQGQGHNAHVNQNGNGHRLGVFQFGEGTNVNMSQNGRDGAALVFAAGW